MNDGSLSDPLLQSLAARLAAAAPMASAAEQQQLLYRCAFAAGQRAMRRKLRRWQATAAALSIIVAGMGLPLVRVYPLLVQRAAVRPAPPIAKATRTPRDDSPVLRHPAAVVQEAWRMPPAAEDSFAAALARFKQTEPGLRSHALGALDREMLAN
jgi:hypothetical protein